MHSLLKRNFSRDFQVKVQSKHNDNLYIKCRLSWEKAIVIFSGLNVHIHNDDIIPTIPAFINSGIARRLRIKCVAFCLIVDYCFIESWNGITRVPIGWCTLFNGTSSCNITNQTRILNNYRNEYSFVKRVCMFSLMNRMNFTVANSFASIALKCVCVVCNCIDDFEVAQVIYNIFRICCIDIYADNSNKSIRYARSYSINVWIMIVRTIHSRIVETSETLFYNYCN